MEDKLHDDHIRQEFRSILNILIHFSFSLTEVVSIMAILGLQIGLTITETCAYHLGIGLWAFPFLLISPISIWFIIWRRTSSACIIAILMHFCSNLFATAVLIVSFLILIGQIGDICSTSSYNSTYIVLNGSIIGITVFFKLFNYGEIILLYMLIKCQNQPSTIFIEDYSDNTHVWRSWSDVAIDTHSNADLFFA